MVDHTFGHLVFRRMSPSKQLELSAALLDEKLERLDNYPALVRIVVSLTQERSRLRLVG